MIRKRSPSHGARSRRLESIALALGAGESVVEAVSITIHPLCIQPIPVDVVAPLAGSIGVTNLTGSQVNGCGDDTSTFEVQFVGSGESAVFDLEFVDAENGGQLAVIPVEVNTPPPPPTPTGAVLSCLYECRAATKADAWREITTLKLTNDGRRAAVGGAAFFDGNENLIAAARVDLSSKDLDELHVCKTLADGGVSPTASGLVELYLLRGGEGAHAWVKDLLGVFPRGHTDPFEGHVRGVAKTQCRVVPDSVTTAGQLARKVRRETPPVVTPVLIEGTAD